mgnify:CR=1 FL=1
MSQEYTEDKEVTLSKLSSGRRLLEALLIVIALFAVWLMAALLSFNPSDPSWSQTAWHEPIHNLGGVPGAWLADTLFFIFGVMAYTLPVIIIGGCWFAWRHRQNDDYIDYFAVSLRLIGALALILTSCGLAAINADDIWYFASGGVIGSLLSSALQPMLHSSGGTIALLCIWAAGLTLFTGWSWVSIAEKLGVTKPSVVRILNLLMEQGMIVKEYYGKIYLTDRGIWVAKRVQQELDAILAHFPPVSGELTGEEQWSAALAMTSALPQRLFTADYERMVEGEETCAAGGTI